MNFPDAKAILDEPATPQNPQWPGNALNEDDPDSILAFYRSGCTLKYFTISYKKTCYIYIYISDLSDIYAFIATYILKHIYPLQNDDHRE